MLHIFETSSTGVFNCTDMNPTPIEEIYGWLGQKLNKPIKWSAEKESGKMRGNKKVSSKKLHSTGFVWKFPDYRSGLESLIEKA
jgi:NAD dependent epimerase/dehydratase family enzyme